jgi:hypothetical protein
MPTKNSLAKSRLFSERAMFEPLLYLLYAVTGFAVFFSLLPLVVAAALGDRGRIERLLDIYIDVFQASSSAVIGALRIFRRKELSSPYETNPLPPPRPVDWERNHGAHRD